VDDCGLNEELVKVALERQGKDEDENEGDHS
jgi:hypothetical protein